MPIYRISDATTGKPLRLVAADNKAVALRHADRALNAEMKRLWNAQTHNPGGKPPRETRSA